MGDEFELKELKGNQVNTQTKPAENYKIIKALAEKLTAFNL